jgi:hypothetical protein
MVQNTRWIAILSALFLTPGAVAEDYHPPKTVKVLPVFFVARGELPPTPMQKNTLLRHLEWAQARYKQMLRGRDTFTLVKGEPKTHLAARDFPYYRRASEEAAPQFVSELLQKYGYNRYNCPGVFVIVLMSPREEFPSGGGRPVNGGLNTGGGIVILSSLGLDRSPNFQSTLQHELGHAFGLPHVEVYGHDMQTSPSIMSYNPNHHTRRFEPGKSLGTLIPEDLRALALNQRAFPRLRFDPSRDVPVDYRLAPNIVTLGPMQIPGQPDGVKVTTASGEALGSKVRNIVQGYILPSENTDSVTFDPHRMWCSKPSPTGWVSVTVEFPFDVQLSGVAVHSQHSGKYHAAEGLRIGVEEKGGVAARLVQRPLRWVDERVAFPPTKAQTWKFDFRAGSSGIVVLRGLQFFDRDDEVFPPLVPWTPAKRRRG